MSGALTQIECPAGEKSGNIEATVIERGDTDCKNVVQQMQSLGSVVGEESLSDDRDRVNEVTFE